MISRDLLQASLAQATDRGTLLRTVETHSREAGFTALADVWAPRLLEEEAFFETFLLHHLDGARHRTLLLKLLPTVKSDTLYAGLYRKVAEEGQWRKDVKAALSATDPLKALGRLDVPSMTLDEGLALQVYGKLQSASLPFLRAHVANRTWWRKNQESFDRLQQAVQDEDFRWHLFREFATQKSWEREVRALIDTPVPAERLDAELRKRHPNHLWNLDRAPLLDVLKAYGAPALPYVEDNAGRHGDQVLEWGRSQPPEVYWRLFFVFGRTKAWNEALRAAMAQPEAELLRRKPPRELFGWGLEPDVALQLYQRSPDLLREFLSVARPTKLWESVWEAASQGRDEATLDLLTLGVFREIETVSWRVKHEGKDRDVLERLSKRLTTRWDRLAPDEYVRHALVTIETMVPPEPSWTHVSPAGRYLAERHSDAWVANLPALQALLDSPHLSIHQIGLAHLARAAAPEAAVQASLVTLQGLLLGSPRQNVRRLALACLERCPDARVDAMLEEAMHLRGRKAIDEHAMVAYVRRQWKSR